MEISKNIYKLLESLTNSGNAEIISVIKSSISIIFEGYTNYDTGLHISQGFQIPKGEVNYQQNNNNEYFKQTLPSKYLKKLNLEANKNREVILPVPFTQPHGIQFNS